jgi:hypothetical protein
LIRDGLDVLRNAIVAANAAQTDAAASAAALAAV